MPRRCFIFFSLLCGLHCAVQRNGMLSNSKMRNVYADVMPFQTFGSCSCIRNEGNVSTVECDRNTCDSIYPFIISIFFCFFSSIITISPSLQITLRCVPFDKRILAISMQVGICLRLPVRNIYVRFVFITAHNYSHVGSSPRATSGWRRYGSLVCFMG